MICGLLLGLDLIPDRGGGAVGAGILPGGRDEISGRVGALGGVSDGRHGGAVVGGGQRGTVGLGVRGGEGRVTTRLGGRGVGGGRDRVSVISMVGRIIGTCQQEGKKSHTQC